MKSDNVRRLNVKEDKKVLEAQLKERDRKRAFVAKELFPMLNETSKSIEDAKMFCTMVASSIRHAHGKIMMEKMMSDIDLSDELNKKSPEYGRFQRAFEMLKQEKVSTALEILDGASQFIDGSQKEEDSKRKLSDLPVKFL